MVMCCCRTMGVEGQWGVAEGVVGLTTVAAVALVDQAVTDSKVVAAASRRTQPSVYPQTSVALLLVKVCVSGCIIKGVHEHG